MQHANFVVLVQQQLSGPRIIPRGFILFRVFQPCRAPESFCLDSNGYSCARNVPRSETWSINDYPSYRKFRSGGLIEGEGTSARQKQMRFLLCSQQTPSHYDQPMTWGADRDII